MTASMKNFEIVLDRVEKEVKKNKFIYMDRDFTVFSEEEKIDWYYQYKEYMVKSKLLAGELHDAFDKIEYLKWLLRQERKKLK